MNLYEIDSAILDCVDLETGEVIDPDRLDALQMERKRKIEAVALWVKNLKAEQAACKAEKDAFAEREKRAKAKAESLLQWLTAALNGNALITNRVVINFRKSEAVEIVDPAKVPNEYTKTKIEKSPDKLAIKAAIKSGEAVPGCELVLNRNVQIK